MTKFQINKEIASIHWELETLSIYLVNYFHTLTNEQVNDIYTKIDELEERLKELRQIKKGNKNVK